MNDVQDAGKASQPRSLTYNSVLILVGYTMSDIHYKWNDGLNSVQVLLLVSYLNQISPSRKLQQQKFNNCMQNQLPCNTKAEPFARIDFNYLDFGLNQWRSRVYQAMNNNYGPTPLTWIESALIAHPSNVFKKGLAHLEGRDGCSSPCQLAQWLERSLSN